VGVTEDHAQSAVRKASRRLIPFLGLCYAVNFLDRVNVGFAGLVMNDDLGFTPEVFGFGAGIFFAGYILFEIPSNLALSRFGARIWIARIMISWGLVATAVGFVAGERRACLQRPTRAAWCCRSCRLAVLFIIEGISAVLLGIFALRFFTDRPKDADWLSPEERRALERRLDTEAEETRTHGYAGIGQALTSPRVIELGMLYFCLVLYGIGFWMPQVLQTFGLSNLRSVSSPLFPIPLQRSAW